LEVPKNKEMYQKDTPRDTNWHNMT